MSEEPALNYLRALRFWFWVLVIGVFAFGYFTWIVWEIFDLPAPTKGRRDYEGLLLTLWYAFIGLPLGLEIHAKLVRTYPVSPRLLEGAGRLLWLLAALMMYGLAKALIFIGGIMIALLD